jgi:hypothetical protein
MRRLFLLLFVVAVSGCGVFTDAATRIAYDIEANVGRLAAAKGAIYVIRHATPSKPGECGGPYKVQFDKVGALIIWCKDSTGQTVSSHSTSYHTRFVDTSETFIIDKAPGSTLSIQIERRNGRPVITKVF